MVGNKKSGIFLLALLILFVVVSEPAAQEEIIVDNGDPATTYTGVWNISAGTNPYGIDSLWARNGATYTWNMLGTVGSHEVFMWWSAASSRSLHAAIDIGHYRGFSRVYVDQRENAGRWVSLGRYPFNVGWVRITASDGPSSTCADAVKFTRVPETEYIIDNDAAITSKTGNWYVSGGTSPYGPDSVWSRDGSTFSWNFTPWYTGLYDVSMWWTSFPSRSDNIPVDIESDDGKIRVYVNQQLNGGKWNLLDRLVFIEGKTYRITVTAHMGPSSTCADAVRLTYVNPSQIIDNSDASTSRTGTWYLSGGENPYGPDSLWSRDGSTFTWYFSPSVTGLYHTEMKWTSWPSRSANIPVDVESDGSYIGEPGIMTERVYINQQGNSGDWNILKDERRFTKGNTYRIIIHAQPGPSSTCADAVRFGWQQWPDL